MAVRLWNIKYNGKAHGLLEKTLKPKFYYKTSRSMGRQCEEYHDTSDICVSVSEKNFRLGY